MRGCEFGLCDLLHRSCMALGEPLPLFQLSLPLYKMGLVIQTSIGWFERLKEKRDEPV